MATIYPFAPRDASPSASNDDAPYNRPFMLDQRSFHVEDGNLYIEDHITEFTHDCGLTPRYELVNAVIPYVAVHFDDLEQRMVFALRFM